MLSHRVLCRFCFRDTRGLIGFRVLHLSSRSSGSQWINQSSSLRISQFSKDSTGPAAISRRMSKRNDISVTPANARNHRTTHLEARATPRSALSMRSSRYEVTNRISRNGMTTPLNHQFSTNFRSSPASSCVSQKVQPLMYSDLRFQCDLELSSCPLSSQRSGSSRAPHIGPPTPRPIMDAGENLTAILSKIIV